MNKEEEMKLFKSKLRTIDYLIEIGRTNAWPTFQYFESVFADNKLQLLSKDGIADLAEHFAEIKGRELLIDELESRGYYNLASYLKSSCSRLGYTKIMSALMDGRLPSPDGA